MKKIYALLSFISLVSSSLLAQITGTVVDAETKSGLPGVSVVVKGTVAGAPTDVDGKFSIPYNGKYPVTIRVSFVGFKTQDIEVKSASNVEVTLEEAASLVSELTVTANRVEERITKSPVTVEKLTGRQLLLGGAFDQYSALQALKGVDLLTQGLTFKSVNLRGFGANNNNRFVQLVDGMDNRSPGFGFGFGSVAGISDLDIDNIELLPGASSALYGPDALQGLMLTKTKSPFDYQGLSAQVKVGVNNVGKSSGPSATPYTDLGIRYAKAIGKFAFKANIQAINGTDFVADNYDDRSHRDRPGFFVLDNNAKTASVGFVSGGNNAATNLRYDGVNIYGDDFTNGGSFAFPANHPVSALASQVVTRTGYNEIDLTGDNGKVFSYRANAALHYKITDKIEAIGAVYLGNGNLFRTAAFREYYPDYRRIQSKLEIRGDNFFVRGYQTNQTAEGFNLGNLAARILQSQRTMGDWAGAFSTAYAGNSNILSAKAAADANKPAVGSSTFNSVWTALTTTNANVATTLRPGGATTGGFMNGVRIKENSMMRHFEGMYNFNKFLPENVEVVTGASYRFFDMLTEGTVFPRRADGSEFTIKEYGAYAQGSYNIKFGENMAFKPIVAVRYDKNEFFNGGLTPRVSGVFSAGEHNLRVSWQSAFRNPSPNQLLSDGSTGEVGGSQTAVDAANLSKSPGYTPASVTAFRASNNVADLVKFNVDPSKFTTEKIKTWEVGYKSLIGNRLYVDAFYYQSTYNDFIAAQNVVQANDGTTDGLKNAANVRSLQVNFNNFNEIYVNGYGLELNYSLGKGYTIAANYANQVGKITLKDNFGNTLKDAFGTEVVKRKMSEAAVSRVQRNFFISPENRFNLSLANPKVTKNIGFNINYRWTDKMWVEQGNTAGDIMLPSWQTIDAAVSYKVPKIRTIIKLGAANMANQYYAQGYGLARIGGMYYISFNFDETLNR
jgi:iron complex outermembrane recepter protein